jgi:FlaA1/EpsC-like NDP-sugar epimerase
MSELNGRARRGDRHVLRAARAHLPVVHFVLDGAIWAVAIPVGVWFRYDFDASRITSDVLIPIALAVALQGTIGVALGQYRRKWRYGSFDEVRMIALTALSVGVVLSVLMWWTQSIPRSVPMLAATISLLGQVAIRSTWRSYVEKGRRPSGQDAERIVVVGAGEAGVQIVRSLLATSTSPYVPVALLDDDPNKRNLRISGVRVAGTVADLAEVVELSGATAVLLAIPSAESSLIRHVDGIVRGLGLELFVLPPVEQLLGGVGLADIAPVSHTDLLGRHPAAIDPVAIAGYLSGRRVLVTGAGGSIGSELCRQIVRYEPAALLMLDRDENGLHGTQLSIEGRALLDDPNLILADIRDRDRIDAIFAEYRPEIVFHAAALKHLPLLESHPSEGWKTNVCGTFNLLEAAEHHGVERFVNVSTDKAANPTSVLGWTKRITERLTAARAGAGSINCVSVRFGNVLGSNGSMLKTFEAQAEAGGPLTVTHPDITRYFMTIEEASRLIVQAGAIGRPGEVMILDMGQPVKIIDVAERIASEYSPPLTIEFTGLRPNEKMHEELISSTESGQTKSHPLITHVQVPPLAPPDELWQSVPSTIEQMRTIALTDLEPSVS